MDDKIAIVILNYNTYDETIECIESINQQIYEKKLVEVILVDNLSTDNSAELLKKHYLGSGIHFIQSNKNYGFANGNNIGILYSRNVLKINNILLLNSDIVLSDPNTLKVLMNERANNVSAIGTTILNSQLREMYQKRLTMPSLKEARKEAFMRNLFIFIYEHEFIYKLYRKIKKNPTLWDEDVEQGHWFSETSDDIWLPGCAFLITEEFFKYYPIIYPHTFLYYEESIFSIMSKKVGLKLKHIDTVSIIHKDGVATNKSENINIQKQKIWAESSYVFFKVYKYKRNKVLKKINRFLENFGLDEMTSFYGEI